MKHSNITVVSISNIAGTSAPSAGPNGNLGLLALKSDIVAGYGIEVVPTSGGLIQVRLYTGLEVTSFTNTSGTTEKGLTVGSTTLNWTINKDESSQSIDQGIGSLTPGIRTYPVTFTPPISANQTFMITASDGTTIDTETTTVSFQQKRWWGTDSSSVATSPLILSLDNNEFSTSRSKSLTIDGLGEYIYYAYPASFGAATFTVNGLLNTAFTLTTVSHTNASGYTENYYVYRTNTVQFGTGINIVVS